MIDFAVVHEEIAASQAPTRINPKGPTISAHYREQRGLRIDPDHSALLSNMPFYGPEMGWRCGVYAGQVA